jgi:DNA adenine methylase
LPTLKELWAGHGQRRLVEPFVGGMSVALCLAPQRALLNDINRHLINFYRWLQRGLTIRIKMAYDEALYYDRRRRFNELVCQGQEDTQEAAELFYYMNRTGYNGLCRFNKRGLYNVPFGQHKSIRYRKDWRPYATVLAGWQFTCVDFERVELDADDFVYADPPYDVEFTSYHAGGFGWEDQVRLAEWLAGHSGPVVASNQATDRIVQLYRGLGFEIQTLDAPRRIANNGDRRPAQEILATRNL